MKWPESLTLVRHGESAFNRLKKEMRKDQLWQEFVRQYDTCFDCEETIRMARELKEKFPAVGGDHKTPLTPEGGEQARRVAAGLKEMIRLPVVIYVSPYVRTRQTLQFMKESWPELADVNEVVDERIREQEHGQRVLYSDWRLYLVFHPEQKELYDFDGRYRHRYLQGESVPDVRARSSSWFYTLIREYAEQDILAITHNLTILSIRAQLERMDEEEFIYLDENDGPINCGVTIYQGDPTQGSDGRFILEVYNKKLY